MEFLVVKVCDRKCLFCNTYLFFWMVPVFPFYLYKNVLALKCSYNYFQIIYVEVPVVSAINPPNLLTFLWLYE